MTVMNTDKLQRPSIFEYEAVSLFINDMLGWRRKSDPRFSIRTHVEALPNCSAALVTQVAKGARNLTRDRVEAFSHILNLTVQETKFLDQWVAEIRQQSISSSDGVKKKRVVVPVKKRRHRPQNSIVSNWLNLYVKESCKLRDFSEDPAVIHKLLGGIASVDQIRKSFEFLMREGFLRRTLDNKIIQNHLLIETSDQIPNRKIRAFHRRALDLVKRNLELCPVEKRQDHTYVLAVNEKNFVKLKKLMTDFMEQVEQFEQEHPDGDEQLFQVSLHLTPASRRSNDLH